MRQFRFVAPILAIIVCGMESPTSAAPDDLPSRLTLDPTYAESDPKPLLLADSPAPVADDWKFSIAPYLWLPSLDGDVTVRDRTLTADQSTEDVTALLENLNFAFSGHFEVEKGRFGVFADILYIDLGGDPETRQGTTIEVGATSWIGELGIFYTVIPPDPSAKHPFRMDILGGVRVIGVEFDVDTDRLGSASIKREWIDPIIGARAEFDLLKWLSVKGRGDIGGFGISEGNTSDFVWNAELAASFKLAKWFHIDLGYRWLDYDYQDGSGDDEFNFDATFNGPFIAFEFRF